MNLRPTEESQFKSRTAQEGAAGEACFAKQSTDKSPQFFCWNKSFDLQQKMFDNIVDI